ncbi:Rho guanine nucleotide exchange factor [Marasmius tenuissimus]|nr:Rho guanine nucleotide exchange factor [Marasmius tenuissimus]
MPPDAKLKSLEESLRSTFADKSKLQDFLAMEGHPAQQWLDSMQQLVDYPHLSPELRPAIFTAMLRLSRNSGLHPECLSIRNVKKVGEHPVAAGGFGDIWKGTIGDSSELVCLKVVKLYLKSDMKKLSKEYLREAILWYQIRHPNVLPFLGIYQLEYAHQLCLISPWMTNGNLVQFLEVTKREDIDHYVLVHDVASGLTYLHSKKIVHVDMKGLNILITGSLRACIADFGLSRIAHTQGLQITASTTRPAGTTRWLAPELLDGGVPSKESDIYSYACVCYEIFTGLQPFPELANEMAVALHVVQGKRPSKPKGAPELSDAMWALMNACWDATPSSRPTAGHVSERVTEVASRAPPASDWSESLLTQVWANVELPDGFETGTKRIPPDMTTFDDQADKMNSLPTTNEAPKRSNKRKSEGGACVRCKSLKARCEYGSDTDPCKRCLNGGHDCVTRGRKKRRTPPKREHLLAEIQKQAETIDKLMTQMAATKNVDSQDHVLSS